MRKRLVGLSLLLVFLVGLGLATTGLAADKEPWTQYDFGGRRVGVAFRFSDVTPLGERGEFNWLEPDSRLAAHIAQVEEMFNVKIDIVPHPGEASPMNFAEEILAGDNYVSCFELDNWFATTNLFPLALGGYIHRLTNLLDEDYYNSIPESFRNTEGFWVGGELYGFEILNFTSEPVVVLWNKDLFDREGFPDLHELYEQGEWTWEVFSEIAIKATQDTDGDGEIDQWGINYQWGGWDQILNFVLTNNANLTETVDGRIVVTVDHPAAVEAIELLQKLEVVHGATQHQTHSHAVGGKMAMVIGSPHTLQFPAFTDISDRYSVVPLPKGPRATEHVFPQWNRWMGVIAITEPEPRAVIELVSALRKIKEPYLDTDLETWEDKYWENWSRYLVDRKSLEIWQEGAIRRSNAHHKTLLRYNGLDTAIQQILGEGASVYSSIAAVKNQMQAALDEMYNQ